MNHSNHHKSALNSSSQAQENLDQNMPISQNSSSVIKTQLPVLAIDYGTKFVGLALATSKIAEPLTSIPQDKNVMQYCGQLVDDYGVHTIVVGVSQRQSAERASQFARLLQHTFGLRVKVETADENFSTQEARMRLAEMGKKIGKDKRIDHFAAAVILENWLEENLD